MPMGGYYEIRLNTGIHDPLHAKVIVLEEGGVEGAIVVCDLLGLPRTFLDATRRIIGETKLLAGTDHGERAAGAGCNAG
jgi:hypothetical protein